MQVKPSEAPLQDRDIATAFNSDVDELEPMPDSSNLSGAPIEDDLSTVLVEEAGAEDVEENPENLGEYFDLPTLADSDSKIANLSLEEARSAIPESVLNSLQKQFNGSLEHCRPVNQNDRIF